VTLKKGATMEAKRNRIDCFPTTEGIVHYIDAEQKYLTYLTYLIKTFGTIDVVTIFPNEETVIHYHVHPDFVLTDKNGEKIWPKE
jgi:hypothetical protein